MSHEPSFTGSESRYLGPASPHLAQSILVTLFCCMPFGIVAIVFSAIAMGQNSSGDYAGAHRSAKSAAMWAWIAFGCGLAGVLLYVLFFVVLAGLGAAGAAANP